MLGILLTMFNKATLAQELLLVWLCFSTSSIRNMLGNSLDLRTTPLRDSSALAYRGLLQST